MVYKNTKFCSISDRKVVFRDVPNGITTEKIKSKSGIVPEYDMVLEDRRVTIRFKKRLTERIEVTIKIDYE